jgi:hypothetical protein
MNKENLAINGGSKVIEPIQSQFRDARRKYIRVGLKLK